MSSCWLTFLIPVFVWTNGSANVAVCPPFATGAARAAPPDAPIATGAAEEVNCLPADHIISGHPSELLLVYESIIVDIKQPGESIDESLQDVFLEVQ